MFFISIWESVDKPITESDADESGTDSEDDSANNFAAIHEEKADFYIQDVAEPEIQ